MHTAPKKGLSFGRTKFEANYVQLIGATESELIMCKGELTFHQA